MVLIYLRMAGSGAFMGDDDEEARLSAWPAWAWLRRNAL